MFILRCDYIIILLYYDCFVFALEFVHDSAMGIISYPKPMQALIKSAAIGQRHENSRVELVAATSGDQQLGVGVLRACLGGCCVEHLHLLLLLHLCAVLERLLAASLVLAQRRESARHGD